MGWGGVTVGREVWATVRGPGGVLDSFEHSTHTHERLQATQSALATSQTHSKHRHEQWRGTRLRLCGCGGTHFKTFLKFKFTSQNMIVAKALAAPGEWTLSFLSALISVARSAPRTGGGSICLIPCRKNTRSAPTKGSLSNFCAIARASGSTFTSFACKARTRVKCKRSLRLGGRVRCSRHGLLLCAPSHPPPGGDPPPEGPGSQRLSPQSRDRPSGTAGYP